MLRLTADIAGLNTLDVQGVAFARAEPGQETTDQNRVWRAFYAMSKTKEGETDG